MKRGAPKHKLLPEEHRAGGLARGAAWRKTRDNQINGRVLRFAALSSLQDLRWRPALQSLARITLLMERSYAVLKERKSLLDERGELCPSIDVFRRLVDSQAGLLKAVGLMPTAVLPEPLDKEIEAAFQRIEAIKRTTASGGDEQT